MKNIYLEDVKNFYLETVKTFVLKIRKTLTLKTWKIFVLKPWQTFMRKMRKTLIRRVWNQLIPLCTNINLYFIFVFCSDSTVLGKFELAPQWWKRNFRWSQVPNVRDILNLRKLKLTPQRWKRNFWWSQVPDVRDLSVRTTVRGPRSWSRLDCLRKLGYIGMMI